MARSGHPIMLAEGSCPLGPGDENVRNWLLGALLAAALTVPASPAGADGRSVPPPPLSGTFLIGDSTLYRVAPRLREVEPDWYIDHERGRPVSALRQRIAKYLRINPNPANFVMALGTNRCHFPEWSYARLRRAISQLPKETNVFLVMVVARPGRTSGGRT